MGFLQDRKILVTGVLSNRSIAYGIAKALEREGAVLAFTYQSVELRERVQELAGAFKGAPVLPCDVAKDEEIAALFEELRKRWGSLDGIVHSIAFAPREALKGDFLDGLTRDAFRIAHDVSAYSFAALAKAGLPLMEGRKAALLTLIAYLPSFSAPFQFDDYSAIIDNAREREEAGMAGLAWMGARALPAAREGPA